MGPDPLADRHAAQHRQHELATGRCEIESLDHASETHPCIAKALERLPLDPNVPRPAVDHVDDDDVEETLLGVVEERHQLRAPLDALAPGRQAVLRVDAHQFVSLASAPALDLSSLRAQRVRLHLAWIGDPQIAGHA
jgi:hypothetical protein